MLSASRQTELRNPPLRTLFLPKMCLLSPGEGALESRQDLDLDLSLSLGLGGGVAGGDALSLSKGVAHVL